MASTTATIVFTDIVGSTAQMSRVGADTADELRREHFALLAREVDRHGGVIVKNLGDGLMLAFDGVVAALACAQDLQRAVVTRNRSSDEAVQIRIGVGTGECDRDGDDFFGPPVVEAARVCAAAGDDQILVTDLVRLLVAGRGSFELTRIGATALKGIEGEVDIWALAWETPLDDVEETLPPLPARLSGTAQFGFVGRHDELRSLEHDWKVVVNGDRRVAMLSGEPGVGKTTLASRFARECHAEGALVVYGRCDEDLGIPYQPWVEIFSFLADHLPGQLDQILTTRVDDLAPFVPSLAGQAQQRRAEDADSERLSLFASSVAAIHGLGQRHPVLVVIDDLQWADRPTLLLLRHLLNAREAGRLMVIGTFRASEVDDRHPLADILAGLHRSGEMSRLPVGGLPDDQLVELLATAAGHELPEAGIDLAHALGRETSGNPFFVIEMLLHLAETGQISRDADTGEWRSDDQLLERGLPISVREVIGRRVARLGDEAGRVLRAASVIGREFDLTLLADVVELGQESTLDQLEVAVDADLIEPTAPGSFQFLHALVEHTLYDSLNPSRRSLLHRRVAESLEVIAPGQRFAERAFHWNEAHSPHDAAKAIESAHQAGDHALSALAPDEACRWYEKALDLLGPDRRSTLGCDLLTGLGTAQRQLARPGYRETLFLAAEAAQAIEDPDRLVQVALANGRHAFSAFGDVDSERIALLEQALAVLGDRDQARRARLLSRLASELTWSSERDVREQSADEALTLARASGDDRTLLIVLLEHGDMAVAPDQVEERRAVGAEALALAEHLGDEVSVFLACEIFFDSAWLTGDLALADAMLARLTEIADRLDHPELRWPLRWRQAERAIVVGDVEVGEQLSTDALEIGQEAGHGDAFIRHLGLIFLLRLQQGRLAELYELVVDYVRTSTSVPVQDAAFGIASVAAGRLDRARDWLDDHRADLTALPLDEQWPATMAYWARTAFGVGDEPAAAVLLELLLPWKHLFAVSGSSVAGPLALPAGLLASQLGRPDAPDLLRLAIAGADRTHDRYHGAEARIRLADHAAEDPQRRARLLDEADALIGDRPFAGLRALLTLAQR